jgi:predicted ArsR family transcriptional regulator
MGDTPDIPSPMAAALDRDGHTATARLVYGALRIADEPLTYDQLAERVGMGRSTVKKACHRLVESGEIERRTLAPDGPGRPPRAYRPLVPCPECDERFLGEQGVQSHYGNQHGVTATDLIGRAGEVGEDPSPPPKPGAEDG